MFLPLWIFCSSLLRLMRRADISLCALFKRCFLGLLWMRLISRNTRDPSQQLPTNCGDSSGLMASERSIWSQSHFKEKRTHNYIMLCFLNHRSLFCFWVIVLVHILLSVTNPLVVLTKLLESVMKCLSHHKSVPEHQLNP